MIRELEHLMRGMAASHVGLCRLAALWLAGRPTSGGAPADVLALSERQVGERLSRMESLIQALLSPTGRESPP
jgi:hypothetical protein